jgi:hypothetical protein
MSDVFYEELVTASPESFAQLLATTGDWLSGEAEQISAGAERTDARLRARFARGPISLTVEKRARLHIGRLTRKKGSVSVPITWEATGYSGLFPVMDAVIQLVRVGPTTSRLVFWGRYDPPLGRAGQLVDKYIAHQVAQSTVRGFVRAIGRRLAEMEEPLAG